MRLATTRKHKTRKERKAENTEVPQEIKINQKSRGKLCRKYVSAWIFENCIDCTRMSAIPQGAFAACKVRDNLERGVPLSHMNNEEVTNENLRNPRPMLQAWELTPLKYNSKLMNSIWGLYNRYSVHNFKKNTDSNNGVSSTLAAAWDTISESRISAASVVNATAVNAKVANIMQNGNVFSPPF